MGPPHLGQRGTNSVGTWPLCSAADNFFCHLQTRIDGVVAGAGTLEHKKSEPFSYREKVQIFMVWCGYYFLSQVSLWNSNRFSRSEVFVHLPGGFDPRKTFSAFTRKTPNFHRGYLSRSL